MRVEKVLLGAANSVKCNESPVLKDLMKTGNVILNGLVSTIKVLS